MSKNKKSTNKHSKNLKTGKQPYSSDIKSSNHLYPSWVIGMFDKDHKKWGMNTLKPVNIDKIFQCVKSYESMTWDEIGKHNKNHFINVSKIIKEAQNRLRELKYDDIEELYTLRVEGTFRIWGKRNNEVLSIIWIDPNHEIYKVEKKYT